MPPDDEMAFSQMAGEEPSAMQSRARSRESELLLHLPRALWIFVIERCVGPKGSNEGEVAFRADGDDFCARKFCVLDGESARSSAGTVDEDIAIETLTVRVGKGKAERLI